MEILWEIDFNVNFLFIEIESLRSLAPASDLEAGIFGAKRVKISLWQNENKN